ncbi:DUF1490 family protein [Mycobacterium sp.]|uniref:DUF1490 family protein n=1 Tax=Mycobacterium sp. TaxID=1785 RepID=UPI003A86C073
MAVQVLLVKAASTVVTGLAGVTAYEVLRKTLKQAPLRQAVVATAEVGLRGTRKAEEVAESARLTMADVMAEARERIGEEAPAPTVGEVHDHDH